MEDEKGFLHFQSLNQDDVPLVLLACTGGLWTETNGLYDCGIDIDGILGFFTAWEISETLGTWSTFVGDPKRKRLQMMNTTTASTTLYRGGINIPGGIATWLGHWLGVLPLWISWRVVEQRAKGIERGRVKQQQAGRAGEAGT